MLNMTNFAMELANKTTEEGLKAIGEVYLPSILIAWGILLAVTIIIALCTLKKGWGNFFLIFILPQIIFFVILLFIFLVPTLPKWTSGWCKGWLSG
jgi:glucan phosphoethanolaminetransferase (alkaline phosphatase superfamily)